MTEYKDFEVIIQNKDSEGSYPLSASGPGGDASGYMMLSDEDYTANNALSELGNSADREMLKAVGGLLFQKLFPGDIKRVYRESLVNNRLRIRLIVYPPELGWLHWEFLYDKSTDIFLGTSTKTLLVRHIPVVEAIKPLTVEQPIRILIMIASPSDLPTLDVSQEKRLVREEMKELIERGQVEIAVLEGSEITSYKKSGSQVKSYNHRMATISGLQDVLRDNYHVFHFIGHGNFDKQIETGVLALEDENTGKHDMISAEVLRTLFQDSHVSLVVLNGCETAVASEKQPLLGIAPALVRGGIPVVVAMQFPISDDTAMMFSRTFYSALADGYPVDAAVAEGRKGIYARFPHRRDWGIPVIFMRSEDGGLGQVKEGEETTMASDKSNHIQNSETYNINSSGGDVATEQAIIDKRSGGIYFGDHAEIHGDVIGKNEFINSTEASFSKEEFVKLLMELRTCIKDAPIDEVDKDIVIGKVASTLNEVKQTNEKDLPEKKDKIENYLKETKTILDRVKDIGEIGQKAFPILVKLGKIIGWAFL